jgi:hypothetical protein
VLALPGAVTATEVQAALELGLTTVKFFPAGTSGGPGAIKALAAPFGDVRFVPTGGVGPKNLGIWPFLPWCVETQHDDVSRIDCKCMHLVEHAVQEAGRQPGLLLGHGSAADRPMVTKKVIRHV